MSATIGAQIQSTAGAIPVRNEKGEVSMQKVKVQRYISGKRPEYAPSSSSDNESDEEFYVEKQHGDVRQRSLSPEVRANLKEQERDDPRLRRMRQRNEDDEDSNRVIQAPEVVSTGDSNRRRPERIREVNEDDEQSSDSELDDETFERRRAILREQALAARQTGEEAIDLTSDNEEIAGRVKKEPGDDYSGSSEEESEYEEYTDSEEESAPRLKPVFVRKKDRVTIQEKERQEHRQKELELEAKKLADERRRRTLKLVEDETRRELQERQSRDGDPSAGWAVVITDDEGNDETEYELWKLRELRRIKRDREERESREREKAELERLRNMTEEERRAELRANPKVITNKSVKGKYKFLQKYYHRGAFYLGDEDNVYKRDFAQPTLEDHFDKTILPKVMQVKNFGRSGRTKYTHLVDQDTTLFDSPWVQETTHNLKFHTNQAGGMKQVFDRPSASSAKQK